MNIAFENLFGRQYEGGANWLETTLLGLGAPHDLAVPSVRRTEALGRRVVKSAVRRALRRPWEDAWLTKVAREYGVDLWVGFAGFEGLGAHRPPLVWFPDFQFRHLPEMFSEAERRERERQWDYVARRADGVVAISRSVAADA